MEDNKTDYYEPSVFWSASARNFRTSARLHLQHLLCQNTLGFLLEKRIKQSTTTTTTTASSSPFKVADLACGNGVWLTDLSRDLADKGIPASLDGFDINDLIFPTSAFLPESVSLKKLDILAKPLPQELIGVYDVIHVRAFVSVIFNENTTPLLSTVFSMLKPGGWLQWEEMKADFIIEPSTPGLEKSACETLAQILKVGGQSNGLRSDFLAKLDQHLINHGFENVSMFEATKRKQDYRGWTDDFLMVWEEIAASLPSKASQPQSPVTREFWTETLEKAIQETEKGVALHQGALITVVGRKPT
ncbi:S-adenosyl-L-methionine-dependent methyltransferase [Nemania abortiva]|nr:S-adenosyl-L-methionine-dependent methyltransferase [Nemania abortiva]